MGKTIRGEVGRGPKKTIHGDVGNRKKVIHGEVGPGPRQSQNSNQSSGDCFVATAAFGTPLAAEIQHLRDFRDQKLRRTVWGRKFIGFYYEYGPHLANLVKKNTTIKNAVRFSIKVCLRLLGKKSY